MRTSSVRKIIGDIFYNFIAMRKHVLKSLFGTQNIIDTGSVVS